MTNWFAFFKIFLHRIILVEQTNKQTRGSVSEETVVLRRWREVKHKEFGFIINSVNKSKLFVYHPSPFVCSRSTIN